MSAAAALFLALNVFLIVVQMITGEGSPVYVLASITLGACFLFDASRITVRIARTGSLVVAFGGNVVVIVGEVSRILVL
jgi:hypothetical protein